MEKMVESSVYQAANVRVWGSVVTCHRLARCVSAVVNDRAWQCQEKGQWV
jgi:hypothetical protein